MRSIKIKERRIKMKRLKILHAIGQRPEMTGSGVYVEAIVKESEKRGFFNYRIAGVPSGSVDPSKDPDMEERRYVFFESEFLDFPVPGMSDVMPYKSSLFRELKGRRLTSYKSAFADALKEAVRRFEPDIIHSNHLFVLTALIRKLFPDIPAVATCHGTELRQYDNCPHLRAFVKCHCRTLDRIIALTADQKREICRVFEIAPEKVVVVGGGYDDTVFARAPKAPAGTVHILYAGKINRSKGVPWLLKSLSRMEDRDWILHMAGGGSGSEFEECMELAGRLGANVSFHGYVDHRRLSELMKTSHVQVLPSFFEGLPLALFEGLASGCRIVATGLPGFSEIFGKAKKDTVDLIPLPPLETIDRPYRKDETLLEDALRESLTKMIEAVRKSPDYEDPEARSIARNYTWGRVFEQVSSVYREIVGDKSSQIDFSFEFVGVDNEND